MLHCIQIFTNKCEVTLQVYRNTMKHVIEICLLQGRKQKEINQDCVIVIQNRWQSGVKMVHAWHLLFNQEVMDPIWLPVYRLTVQTEMQTKSVSFRRTGNRIENNVSLKSDLQTGRWHGKNSLTITVIMDQRSTLGSLQKAMPLFRD